MSKVALRVAEVSSSVAASACGRLFAALGHDVVKCEPAAGDALRRQPPFAGDGGSLMFRCLNADKQSVVLDAGADADRRYLTELLAASDVLITDWDASTVLGGADAAGLHEAHPELVVASLTPFGLTPDAPTDAGDSLLAEAYGGLATLIGAPERRPLALGGDQSAYLAAFAGFLGASTALIARDHSGRGDLVDVAQCDVAAFADWKSDITYAVEGRAPRRPGVRGDAWRVVPARDGGVGVIFQPHQWSVVKLLVDDRRLDDPRLDTAIGRARFAESWWPVVEDWVAQRPKRDTYERAQALGLPFAYAADLSEVATWPQYVARGFITAGATSPVGPLVRSAELPWRTGAVPELGAHRPVLQPRMRPRVAEAQAPTPLTGVVVLDLGTITAGAATARFLADYGATVIKVESPSHPDPFRAWNPAAPGEHDTNPMFESNNVGKRSVTLDLKTPDEKDAFRDLVRCADVLVENFRVGVTARLGIDHASLQEVNDRLLYVSLSSYGQTGPEASATSFGSSLDLMSGLASLTGYGDGPHWSSNQVNYPDQVVALLGAGMVVYCLQQGIRGAHLDIAQVEVMTWTLAPYLADYLDSGHVTIASGNTRPDRAPCDTYPAAEPDEWVAVSCASDDHRRALHDVVGCRAEEFSLGWWVAHRDTIDREIADWTSRRQLAACVQQLRAAGVPSVPVLNAETRAGLDRFTTRKVALNTPTRLKGHPFVLGSFSPAVPTSTPPLGADTHAIVHAARTTTDGRAAFADARSGPC